MECLSTDSQVMSARRDLFSGVIRSLFLLEVVAKVIDPVMGPFQFGCIKCQIRTIEATNIGMMKLLLVIYPSIG